ncbi:MAG: hypothetical protein ACXVCE_00030 [Bacteriovorax sp.]
MKLRFFLFWLLATAALSSCENNVTLTPKVSRFVASEHLQKMTGKENLSSGVKELLSDSVNNPKFPLPYYLVPEEDAHFLMADSLDSSVADQLIMKISGQKHFKLFVHPESEAHYDFLRSAYTYIGPDKTEFMASPTSSHLSLVVWNKNSADRRPFIVKTSLDKNIDHQISINEIERSIANQKVLDRIGKKKLEQMNFKFFPESAGLALDKNHSGASKKLGQQLIQEIPDEILNGEKKWFSFSSLMAPNGKPRPLILDVIEKSGMDSVQFFETYMIDNYMQMFEEISFKNGVNFRPHPQGLFFEITNELRPTGKWGLSDFGGTSPDVLTMAKHGGPVGVYLEAGSAAKYKLLEGRSDTIRSYISFYKGQVFDMMVSEVAKFDSSLTPEKIQTLKSKIDKRFVSLVNKHLGLSLLEVPNMSNQQKIEKMAVEQTEFSNLIAKKELKESENLRTLIDNKKLRNEWIELASKKGKSEFYLTGHGLYEVSNKMVVGLALFNRDELEDYEANNKMLSILNAAPVDSPKTGCLATFAAFLK